MNNLTKYLTEKLHIHKGMKSTIDLDDKEYILRMPARKIENKAFDGCINIEYEMGTSKYKAWILSLDDIKKAYNYNEEVPFLYCTDLNKKHIDELSEIIQIQDKKIITGYNISKFCINEKGRHLYEIEGIN